MKRSLAACSGSLLLGLLAGCVSMGPAGMGPRASCCDAVGVAAASAQPADEDRALGFESDDGRRLSLAGLNGRPRVVALFYSSCHITCPITLTTMKGIKSSLSAGARSEVGFVLITFVPEQDSAAVLRSFRRTRQLDEHWTLLRGSARATREAADTLGLAYASGAFGARHSSEIVVLDADGRVVARKSDLHSSAKDLVAALEVAAANSRLARESAASR